MRNINIARSTRCCTALACIGAAALSTGVAYAAKASSSTAKTGAAAVAVGHCDASPSNWTLVFNETGTTVTSVAVSGISAACNGKSLWLAVRLGNATPVASGNATIASGSAVVTFGTPPAWNTFDTEDLAILG